MRKVLFILFACWLAGTALAADSPWLTSLPDAQARAKKENKLILLNFTGSDWCPPCIRLETEVFSKKEFIDYATTNLALVEVDFPLQKKQSAELIAANEALEKKFNVVGHPTLIVLKPDGKIVWTHEGFLSGGPAAMIAKLDELKSK